MYIKTNLDDTTFRAIADIAQFDADTQRRIREVVHAKAAAVQRKAVELAPLKTGKLKGSIRLEYTDTLRHASAKVYTQDPIAHLVEYGAAGAVVLPKRRRALAPGAAGWFMAKAVIPQRAAHPFMAPAIDAVRPTIAEAVREAITGG